MVVLCAGELACSFWHSHNHVGGCCKLLWDRRLRRGAFSSHFPSAPWPVLSACPCPGPFVAGVLGKLLPCFRVPLDFRYHRAPQCWLRGPVVEPAPGLSSLLWTQIGKRKPGEGRAGGLRRVEFQEWQVRTGPCGVWLPWALLREFRFAIWLAFPPPSTLF